MCNIHQRACTYCMCVISYSYIRRLHAHMAQLSLIWSSDEGSLLIQN